MVSGRLAPALFQLPALVLLGRRLCLPFRAGLSTALVRPHYLFGACGWTCVCVCVCSHVCGSSSGRGCLFLACTHLCVPDVPTCLHVCRCPCVWLPWAVCDVRPRWGSAACHLFSHTSGLGPQASECLSLPGVMAAPEPELLAVPRKHVAWCLVRRTGHLGWA